MAFRQFCPVINDAFAFLDAFIKNQTAPRSAHYPMLEHESHDYVRAVKWIVRAFTSHLCSIDAELDYDATNYIVLDYKQLADHFKGRGTMPEFQNRHYWSRHARAFCRMMQTMLNDWFDYDDNTSRTNNEWFDSMSHEFRCGFIAFTECLELLSSLITQPGRHARVNYQSGFGNWCTRDSHDAIDAFSILYCRVTG